MAIYHCHVSSPEGNSSGIINETAVASMPRPSGQNGEHLALAEKHKELSRFCHQGFGIDMPLGARGGAHHGDNLRNLVCDPYGI